ncbi:MAG: hypothetical protein ABGX27_04485 [Desulfurobacteriaceae bacterium]
MNILYLLLGLDGGTPKFKGDSLKPEEGSISFSSIFEEEFTKNSIDKLKSFSDFSKTFRDLPNSQFLLQNAILFGKKREEGERIFLSSKFKSKSVMSIVKGLNNKSLRSFRKEDNTSLLISVKDGLEKRKVDKGTRNGTVSERKEERKTLENFIYNNEFHMPIKKDISSKRREDTDAVMSVKTGQGSFCNLSIGNPKTPFISTERISAIKVSFLKKGSQHKDTTIGSSEKMSDEVYLGIREKEMETTQRKRIFYENFPLGEKGKETPLDVQDKKLGRKEVTINVSSLSKEMFNIEENFFIDIKDTIDKGSQDALILTSLERDRVRFPLLKNRKFAELKDERIIRVSRENTQNVVEKDSPGKKKSGTRIWKKNSSSFETKLFVKERGGEIERLYARTNSGNANVETTLETNVVSFDFQEEKRKASLKKNFTSSVSNLKFGQELVSKLTELPQSQSFSDQYNQGSEGSGNFSNGSETSNFSKGDTFSHFKLDFQELSLRAKVFNETFNLSIDFHESIKIDSGLIEEIKSIIESSGLTPGKIKLRVKGKTYFEERKENSEGSLVLRV